MYQNKAEEPKNVILEKGLTKLSDVLRGFATSQPEFQVDFGDTKKKMKIMQVFSHPASFSSRDIPTKISLGKKFRSDDKKKVTVIETTADECRRICRDAQLTQCSAFSFCRTPKGTGECALVGYASALSDSSIIEDDSGCDMYTLSPFSLFEKGEEGHLSFSQSFDSASQTDSSSCAKKCLEDNRCKSFAICRGSDLIFGCEFFTKSRPAVTMDYEQLCTLYTGRYIFLNL